jgi:hypothetical protein
MSSGPTIRLVFVLALAACACAALPARAGEKEFRDCTAALKAGRPYPGAQQKNVEFVKQEWHAADLSRVTIKALTEEKLSIDAMEAFVEPGTPNAQKVETVRREIEDNLRWETGNLKWLEDGATQVTNLSCSFAQGTQGGGSGTTATLELSGQPVSAAPTGAWTVVAPGQIEQHAYGYGATYTWSTLPYHIGPEGFDLTLTVVAQCSNGQRLSTGINLRGGVDFVKSAGDNTNVPTDLAAYCENNTDTKSLTVHVKPAKTYGAGQDVVITLGAFYGPNVTYHYKPVRTGS